MTDDKPLELAVIAAAMVQEHWLPGVKGRAMPDVIRVMAKFLRDWPTSKPETLWITAQGEAPDMKPWSAQPYKVQRAVATFRAVLLAMDYGLAPEPVPPVPLADPGKPWPGKHAFDAPRGVLAPLRGFEPKT
jgi:hypothetical protein